MNYNTVLGSYNSFAMTARSENMVIIRSINGLFILYGAVEKTRTSTGFPPQRPQRCASTNSATTAFIHLVLRNSEL